jgi:hypothetical protein
MILLFFWLLGALRRAGCDDREPIAPVTEPGTYAKNDASFIVQLTKE